MRLVASGCHQLRLLPARLRIVRDADGEPLSVDQDRLPDPLKRNRLTMTTVDRDGEVTLLGYADALTALADAHEQDVDDGPIGHEPLANYPPHLPEL